MSSLGKYFNFSAVSCTFNHYQHLIKPAAQTTATSVQAAPRVRKKISLVALHSLLSSKNSSSAFSEDRFVRPLCESLAVHHQRDVEIFVPTARNHGDSDHSPDFTLLHLACDLDEFIQTQGVSNPVLIGHSMGGKTAMLYSMLTHLHGDRKRPAGLVSLDASPAKYTHNHSKLFDAMWRLDLANLNSVVDSVRQEVGTDKATQKQVQTLRRKVDHVLTACGISSPADRAFVAQNLNLKDVSRLFASGDQQIQINWKCNLPVIRQNEHHIHDFPHHLPELQPCHTRSLFIGGSASSRLMEKVYLQQVRTWFPNHSLTILDKGGHFIHRTHEKQVVDLIYDYVASLDFDQYLEDHH